EAPAAPAVPIVAPIPSPHVLRELGRPDLTAAEEELVRELDPHDQAWRVLFLRYIDVQPAGACIDAEAVGRAIDAYLEGPGAALVERASAPPERTSVPPEHAGALARDSTPAPAREAAPLSRPLRRVPAWVLVLAGVV